MTTEAVMQLNNSIDSLTGKFNYIEFSDGTRQTTGVSGGTWTATNGVVHPITAGSPVAVGTTTQYLSAALTANGPIAAYRNGQYNYAISEVGGTSTGQTLTNPVMLGSVDMSGADSVTLGPIVGNVWNSTGSWTVNAAVNEDVNLNVTGSGTVKSSGRDMFSGFHWVGTQTYSVTGTTAEQTFVDVSIPANSLGDYGYCEVEMFGTCTNNATNNRTPKAYLDGTLLKQLNITTNTSWGLKQTFYNMGAGTQTWHNTYGFLPYTNSTAFVQQNSDSSVNPLVLSIRGQLAVDSEQLDITKVIIRVYGKDF